ncbi:hypothetical protein NDU88_010134 [Pleurodeles waltl]|uniref:Uncharacterized protein n=1 Tax=Pleurodeles waltl TaxID=8319 RepID=A0AAV7QTJ1_PLEWA|nr:hypothetical protein NDU88_010134 [Pleurodeles waltl]
MFSSSGLSVRKSKAADEARSHTARRARAEYHRQSMRAIKKGRVAGLSNLFQGASPTNGESEMKLDNNSPNPLTTSAVPAR